MLSAGGACVVAALAPRESRGAVSSAGGYLTAPALTPAGGLTESTVGMKSAEFGWLELICHPERISASTSSWLGGPGFSAPPSLSAPILTTSDGLGRSWACTADGHPRRTAIAS